MALLAPAIDVMDSISPADGPVEPDPARRRDAGATEHAWRDRLALATA
jgi:hypothetical protein